ncbi:hypothetical protein CK203_095018 [Vitis vinifera]|uniref:Uncharacterized protein n=1 Tax=Vitis vinifera TaxID=29760 RepID=A0A438ED04_VITVI|nr:hypothetical protein CK203_095018 [Vitis vinifera]
MASLLAAPSFSPQLRIFQGLRTKAIKTLNSVQLPAIRCSLNSNQTLKTCKICKTQFDPLLNTLVLAAFTLLILACPEIDITSGRKGRRIVWVSCEIEVLGIVGGSWMRRNFQDMFSIRIAVNREATELNVDAVQLLGVLDPMVNWCNLSFPVFQKESDKINLGLGNDFNFRGISFIELGGCNYISAGGNSCYRHCGQRQSSLLAFVDCLR